MLRIIQNSSAVGAKSYYSTADYYSQGQELVGRLCGMGARRLGLFGDVDQPTWDALCDNRDPQTGKTLTLRQKDYRRIGYDFNFHVPKSLSLLYTLTQDERLLDAFRASVHETMQDMERELQTRVRKGGINEDRTTGNMVWGEFVHFTSRPVDGLPDPHLHAHCFVFILTQSLPSLYAVLHGPAGRHPADALLANFGHVVVHACDPVTADWASAKLGKTLQTFLGGSLAPAPDLFDELVGRSQYTGNFSEHYEAVLQPNAFMNGLRTGGHANQLIGDAMLLRNGQPFANGENWLRVSFSQA